MAVSEELVNFNKLFIQLKHPPLIINDIVETSEEEKSILKNLVFTKYDSDVMKNIPSCDCGNITGEYNIGVTCKNCDTEVVSSVDKELEPILWVRAPKNVRALINPAIWTMLTDKFKKANFDTIQWITDTTYRAGPSDGAIVAELTEAGINRGYNNFVDNFYEIISKLNDLKSFSNKYRNTNDLLLKLIIDNKDSVFSQYLPLVNRTLLVIESTTVGTYVDPFVPTAIDAILTVASIDSVETAYSQRVKENRTAKFLAGISSYYKNFAKNNLGRKTGNFRQHVYGSRSHFSFRAVVTSLTDAHEYDEIHIPWSIAITVFKYHLINKLHQRNYTVNQALFLINAHAKIYNPLLDEIFKELIDESPRKGIDVTINRNPSLVRGSIQRVRVTKVKTDIGDNTVSFSILIVTPLNGDFDGKSCHH